MFPTFTNKNSTSEKKFLLGFESELRRFVIGYPTTVLYLHCVLIVKITILFTLSLMFKKKKELLCFLGFEPGPMSSLRKLATNCTTEQ